MSQNDAKIWLGYAETDLQAAQTLLASGEFFPRQVCFFAQQCGEKALKAILVFEDLYFPKNHDLDRLRDLIPNGWKVKEQFPDLAELTVWAVESRYPSQVPDATEGEAKETLQLAEMLFKTVSAELDKRIQQKSE